MNKVPLLLRADIRFSPRAVEKKSYDSTFPNTIRRRVTWSLGLRMLCARGSIMKAQKMLETFFNHVTIHQNGRLSDDYFGERT